MTKPGVKPHKQDEKLSMFSALALLVLLGKQSKTVPVLPARCWPGLPHGFRHRQRMVPSFPFAPGTFYQFDDSHLVRRPWSRENCAERMRKIRLFDDGKMQLVGLQKHRFTAPLADRHQLECFSHYMRDCGRTFLCNYETRSCMSLMPGLLEPNELLAVPQAPVRGFPMDHWEFYLGKGGERFFQADDLPKARRLDTYWVFLTCRERLFPAKA